MVRIFTPRQHCFQPGFSCLVRLNWFLVSMIGQNQSTEVSVLTLQFSTFLRHSTVFLTVVCSVNSVNMVCGTVQNWLHLSLSDRYQRVGLVENGAQSSWLPVLSGVPQGTVLGPLLFLIYINDIVLGIDSEIRLFADDCIVYIQIRNWCDSVSLQVYSLALTNCMNGQTNGKCLSMFLNAAY